MKKRLVLLAAVLSVLLVCSAGLSLAACPQDMTNYWSLNESAQPYVDSVGGKNATCTNCPSPITGIVGGAQSFTVVDGIGKDVSAPATDLNWAAGDSFTIELWANTTSCTSQTEIMVGRAGTENNLQWWVGCNMYGKFKFRLNDSTGNGPATITSTKSFNDGQWHYLVGIYDAAKGELRFYVDKELQLAEAATFASDFSAASSLSIGYLPLDGNNYYYGGALDEIAITKRAISDSEIIDHWNNGAGKNYCGEITTNNPPSKPELASPANGAQTETTVTFTWKNSTDPDGDPVKYKIYYSTDPNFTGCVPIEVASTGGPVYYAGMGGLGAGFLMIGFSFFGISSRRRRIALLLLGIIILSAGLLVACGGGGGGSSTPPPTVNETSYTAGGLTNGSTYYWKVSAEDGKGGATESDAWSFSVK